MISKSLQFRLFSTASIFLIFLIAFLLIFSKVFAATTDLKFVNHIEANFPEQDVFVVSKDDSKMVVRVEGETAKDPNVLSQKVYTSSEAVAHDPFKMGTNPLGPYPKGQVLGFTLEQWLGAKGSGTYTVDGDTASLDLTFDALVPNGVYTVWCSRLTFPPNPKVVDRPCGAADGSENSFKAFANGGGEFKLKMKPLEESTKETASVIALAYHSDGKTYGADTGPFGQKTHVQVFAMIPAEQMAASSAPVATPVQVQGVGGISKKVWVIAIAVVVVVILGWWWFSKKTPGSPQMPSSPEA